VHLTETCEDDLPHLITNGETTIGPAADGAATPKRHAALQQRGLLPGTHIVDTGFLDAELFVDSRDDDGVDLLGPTRLDDQGKPAKGPALTPSISRLIGASNTQPARPASPALDGRRPWITVGIWSSR
jgi:transposase